LKEYKIFVNNTLIAETGNNHPLQIEGKIEIKSAGGVLEMELSVYNLSQKNRKLASQNPVNTIILELNGTVVFDGEIINNTTQNLNYTDIVTTYYCKEYNGARLNQVISVSVRISTLSGILSELSRKAGIPVVNNASDQAALRFTAVGSVKEILDQVKAEYGINYSISNRQIRIWDAGGSFALEPVLIPPNEIAINGLTLGLGTGTGVLFVQFKLRPELQSGDKIQINNTDYLKLTGSVYTVQPERNVITSEDGTYTIDEMVHTFNYYSSQPFETTIRGLF